jgi:pilus assembly protein Flp/PilA
MSPSGIGALALPAFDDGPMVVPSQTSHGPLYGPGEPAMRQLFAHVKMFVAQEEGATMVEYGLMVALIAIGCVSAVALVGTNLKTLFNNVGASVSGGS